MNRSKKVQLLHVDDDADFLEVAKRHLEKRERLDVETETDPKRGLERATEFDCVILDYKMAEMDGLQFLQRLRADSEVPVIFFTGTGTEDVAVEAINSGVTDYLRKSTNVEQYEILSNRVEHLVDKERAEAAAAAADQRVREVYERITVAFFAVDDDWRFSYLNDHAESLLSTDESTLLGAELWEQFPDLEGTDAEFRLREAAHDGDKVSVEAELSSPEKYVELHAFPDDSGVSVFVNDVTDLREQAAEMGELQSELEISEEQFRTLKQKMGRPPSPFR